MNTLVTNVEALNRHIVAVWAAMLPFQRFNVSTF